MPRAAALAVAAAATTAAALLAGCGSSGPETNSPGAGTPTAAVPTPGELPFHYQALGESSSPSFRVATAGTYTVAYTLKGSTQTPGCTMSIAMVADDGASQQVVPGVQLQPSDTKQGSVPVTLTATNWRFQEGGGCSWEVTVTKSPAGTASGSPSP